MSFDDFSKKNKERLNKEIDSYLNSAIRELDQASFIKDCYSLIKEYVLSGGKRIRPLAFLMSYSSSGGKDMKKAFLPAISIELYHTYTLILDDIMDEDELRRNRPTIYKSMKDYFLKTCKDENYDGSLFSKKSNKFAVSFAMMLGNITGILSRKAILESEFPDELKTRALGIIEKADEQIYHGQMEDIMMENLDRASEKKYREMIRLKTGILFGMSFELGALFAGADDNTQFMLKETGINSAMAFQLQDDIIDVLGEKGHEKGADIKKGKKTLLIIKAYEKTDSSQKKILDRVFGNQKAGEDAINKVIRIMHETGALDYCRKLSDNYIIAAKKNIDALKLDSYYREVFSGFADSMAKRIN